MQHMPQVVPFSRRCAWGETCKTPLIVLARHVIQRDKVPPSRRLIHSYRSHSRVLGSPYRALTYPHTGTTMDGTRDSEHIRARIMECKVGHIQKDRFGVRCARHGSSFRGVCLGRSTALLPSLTFVLCSSKVT